MVNNISMWLNFPQIKLFVIRRKLKAGCYLFKIVDLWVGSWLYIGFFYIDLVDCVKYLCGSVFFNSLSKDRVFLGGRRTGISLHISVEMNIWISCIRKLWNEEINVKKIIVWSYEYMKIIYVNCRVKNYMKVDHRSYRRNLCSYEKKAWKKKRKKKIEKKC